jgi:hypothetical protein
VQDGARDALVGYLYQLVGVAGLRARATLCEGTAESLDCVLLNWIQQGSLLHEVFGQDAAVRLDGQRVVAVQFKYSRRSGGAIILPSEFQEILHTFDCSRREALPTDQITRFVIITNRRLDQEVQALYEKRDEPQPPKGLLPHGNNKLTQKIVEAHGTRENAAPHWHNILRNLIICERLPLAAWTDSLRSYAQSHGLDDSEFTDALDRLIGNLVQTTVNRTVDVSCEWLNEQMVGASDARPLCLDACDPARVVAGQRVEGFITELAGVSSGMLVRRRYLQRLDEEIKQRGIVFLTGGGGCGKSVLAAHYLVSQAPRALVFAKRARTLEDQWLGRALRACRSTTRPENLLCDSDSDVLSRVRRANPDGEPPLLIIDVDGLDEWSGHGRHVLDRLIEMVQTLGPDRPTAASLILTARAPSGNPERAHDYLVWSWLPTGPSAQQAGVVFIDDFDFDELYEAADRMVGGEVRNRIQAALRLQGARDPTATLDWVSLAADGEQQVNLELVTSLLHPALWGAFLGLAPDRQQQALEGNSEALAVLAKHFVERFCRKVWDRMGDHPMGLDRVHDSLRTVGFHFPSAPAVGDRQRHWLSPLSEGLSPTEARHLYEEAISYGLIREDQPGRWRWRHGFIGDYLRQDGGSR